MREISSKLKIVFSIYRYKDLSFLPAQILSVFFARETNFYRPVDDYFQASKYVVFSGLKPANSLS